MPHIWELVPDADTLVNLEPEELGGLLLQALATRANTKFTPGNFESEIFGSNRSAYPREKQTAVLQAIREAFAWLDGQALIVSAGSDGSHGWRVLSKRGQKLSKQGAWDDYRKGSLLPKSLLHSRIADAVFFNFQRGDYQTAVFISFREVEIAVRDASGVTGEIGMRLMRAAFHPATGKLTDPKADSGEQQALSDLFAGAIGSYKNPHSHRRVDLDTEEAVEMLVLASQLLRIVDARRPK